MLTKKFILLGTVLTLASFSGCGSSNDSNGSEDSSSSGSVASAVGGAYNGSSSGGTQATRDKSQSDAVDELLASFDIFSKAYASSTCSSFSLSGCILNGSVTQTLSSCTFGSSSATWDNGNITSTCSGSISSPSVHRVVSNGTTRTNSFGTVVTLKSSSLTTFNSASIAGTGTTYTPSSLTIGGIELTGSKSGTTTYDHVITSSALTLVGSVVTGTVTVYHNLAKVIGTSTVNLSFTSGCCTPSGGTISTKFQAYGAFAAKSGFDSATETLTFTGCGAATYVGPEGSSTSVTLSNCI